MPQIDKNGKIIKAAIKTPITRSAHSCVLLGKGEYLSTGVEPDEDMAAGADVDPTVPDTGPEEEITGDEEGSDEEIPDIQPPLLMPSASPEPTVPETGPEEEMIEAEESSEEAQADDLLEILAPMPKSAVTPVGEFLDPQDLVVKRVCLLKPLF